MNCYSKHSVDINYKGEKWNEQHDCLGINFGRFKSEKFLLFMKDSYGDPSTTLGYNKMWSVHSLLHVGGALGISSRKNDGLKPLIFPVVSVGNKKYAFNFTYKPGFTFFILILKMI